MQLIRYDRMCTAIAEAHAVDEVKDIRDQAVAAEAYFKQAKNLENESRAAEIRIRAERKAGQLLKAMEKAKGGQPYQSHNVMGRNSQKTLKDMDITPGQSSRWQQLAEVPDDKFESGVTSWREEGRPPATSRVSKKEKPIPNEEQERALEIAQVALYFWGELGRMVDRADVAGPAEIVAAYRKDKPYMLEHVCDYIDKIIPYLEKLKDECS